MRTRPTSDEQRDRLIFYPVAVIGGLFCLSLFVTIAAIFGDPDAPVNRWINHNSGTILLAETGILMVIGLLAMWFDRVNTLRKQRESAATSDENDSFPYQEES